jgi:hypothetical protein
MVQHDMTTVALLYIAHFTFKYTLTPWTNFWFVFELILIHQKRFKDRTKKTLRKKDYQLLFSYAFALLRVFESSWLETPQRLEDPKKSLTLTKIHYNFLASPANIIPL